MIRSLRDLERVDWQKVATTGEVVLPPEPVTPPPVRHLDLSTEFSERDFTPTNPA
jgi:hypothetical protein